MLVLSRKVGEEVIINGNIRVVVVGASADKVRLGVDAPREIPVDREEVVAERKRREVDVETL